MSDETKLTMGRSIESVRLTLPVEEKHSLSVELSEAVIEMEKQKAILEEAKLVHKVAIAPLKSLISKNAKILRDNFVDVDISVDLVADYTKFWVDYVDETGEVVGGRRMTEQERQFKMF